MCDICMHMYICVYMCVCVCSVCVCLLFSEVLPYTDFNIFSHPALSHRIHSPFPGKMGRIAGIPPRFQSCLLILNCQPALGVHSNWIVFGTNPHHSPWPWQWICPDYVVFLLKIFSVPILGWNPDFLVQRALCSSVSSHIWLFPYRSILVQIPCYPTEPGCIQCPHSFFCPFSYTCECPLSIIYLTSMYLSIFCPT